MYSKTPLKLKCPIFCNSAQKAAVNAHSTTGFALVIALGMMAFLLLLMVSLSVFMQVELQVGSQQQKQEEARQNALLAVQVALSNLQKYTGPDQRITAKADILDENAVHRHWTGVWHTNPPGGSTPFETGQPRWLVSTLTEFPDPSNEILANPITLVGAASSDSSEVLADLIPINQDGNAIGNFAFWVGDEGVKVNILAREPDAYKEIENNAYADQILRLSMAHEPRWQRLFGNGFTIQPTAQDQLFSLRQLRLIDPDLPVTRHFHDLSPFSSGVLANVANGGLKKDLTRILAPGFSGDYPNSRLLLSGAGFPDPPTWGLLRSFYNSGNDSQLGTSWGNLNNAVNVRPQSFAAGTHGVSPILGMWQMNWGARYDPSSEPTPNRVQITMIPVIKLINPHNVALTPTTYRVRLHWRRGSVQNLDGEGGTPVPNGALMISWNQAITNNTNYDVAPYINQDVHGDAGIEFEIRNVGFAPGEARIFSISGQHFYRPGIDPPLPMAPGWNPISNFAALNFEPARFLAPSELAGSFWFRMRWSSIDAVLSAEVADGNDSSFQEIQRVDQALYITERTHSRPKNPILLSFAATPNRIQLRHSNHSVIQHSSDQTSGARWLALYNPRAAVSGRDRQNSSGNHSLTGQPLYDGYDRPLNINDVNHNGNRGFWGGDNRAGQGQHFVPLYDIPRQPIVSLGKFQHANLSSQSWQPGYAFANSWASPYYEFNEEDISHALNRELWDDFFFSGLDNGLTNWPAAGEWRNTRLRPLPDADISNALTWDRAAANLSLLGAFNINSTSVSAWESLLKSLQGLRVPYDDPALATGIQSAATGSNTPFPRNQVSSATSNIRWRGFRALTASEINQLAEAIVAEIRARGPFRSLAQFVNRDLTAARGSRQNLAGALQAAIDNTSINATWSSPAVPQNTGAPVNQYREASAGPRSSGAPSYLTQADLLQALAPVISARSDTFRIRAYGSSLNPFNGSVQAQVWCEVIVQRLPEYVNSSDAAEVFPPTDPTNENFGRKYKIVGFRWLQSDEI